MSQSPDLIQPVIGFRIFALPRTFFTGPAGGEPLISAGMGGYVWRPGRNRAECRLRGAIERGYNAAAVTDPGHSEPAPASGCACGFYGWHQLGSILHHRWDTNLPAAIASWGRIEVHPGGFRAEWAKVVAIGMPEPLVLTYPTMRRALEELAARYGADCVPLIDLEEAAFTRGITVPEDLRPELPRPEPDPAAGLQAGGLIIGRPASVHIAGVTVSHPSPPPDPPKPKLSPLRGLLFGVALYAAVLIPLDVFAVGPWWARILAAIAAQWLLPNRLFRLWRRLHCWFDFEHMPRRDERCARCGYSRKRF